MPVVRRFPENRAQARVRAAVDITTADGTFDNPSPTFHNAQAAARAWDITSEFLARTLRRE